MNDEAVAIARQQAKQFLTLWLHIPEDELGLWHDALEELEHQFRMMYCYGVDDALKAIPTLSQGEAISLYLDLTRLPDDT